MSEKLKEMLKNITLENKHEILWDDTAVQQERVGAYLWDLLDGAIGVGEDPIGFLMASHSELSRQRNELREENEKLLNILDIIFIVCCGHNLIQTGDEAIDTIYKIVHKYGRIPDVEQPE